LPSKIFPVYQSYETKATFASKMIDESVVVYSLW